MDLGREMRLDRLRRDEPRSAAATQPGTSVPLPTGREVLARRASKLSGDPSRHTGRSGPQRSYRRWLGSIDGS